MSRVASKKSRRIELGDGEWIEVRTKLSFREIREFQNSGGDNEAAIDFLKRCITGWNLKDDDGNDFPFTGEAILDLDMPTIKLLTVECGKATGATPDPVEEKKDERS